MHVSEEMIRSIVQEVVAKMQGAEECSGKHGVFKDMNEAELKELLEKIDSLINEIESLM